MPSLYVVWGTIAQQTWYLENFKLEYQLPDWIPAGNLVPKNTTISTPNTPPQHHHTTTPPHHIITIPLRHTSHTIHYQTTHHQTTSHITHHAILSQHPYAGMTHGGRTWKARVRVREVKRQLETPQSPHLRQPQLPAHVASVQSWRI